MRKLGSLLEKGGAQAKLSKTSDCFVMPACLTGLEFECEGVTAFINKNTPGADYWKRVADGSLRGQSAEYVLAEPLFGEDLRESIEFICSQGALLGYTRSYRTSLHVHLDVRDMAADELSAMMCIYALLEPCIYNYIGNNRRNSNYCRPWYASVEFMRDVGRVVHWAGAQKIENLQHRGAVEQEFIRGLKDINDAQLRYSGFNVAAVAKYGSVEFRHQLCTFEKDLVIDWINICQSIKQAGIRLAGNSFNNIVRLVSELGVRNIFNDVFYFGDLRYKMDYKELEDDVLVTGIGTCNVINTCINDNYNRSNVKEIAEHKDLNLNIFQDILNKNKSKPRRKKIKDIQETAVQFINMAPDQPEQAHLGRDAPLPPPFINIQRAVPRALDQEF
jgi:Putative amidoligase enzyme